MCHYCYATSYIGRRPSSPKIDLIYKLKRDAGKADKSLPVDISLSSDPYPWIETKLNLTRKVLEVLIRRGFRVQITTKSDLVIKDIDLIKIGGVAVSLTITTLDDNLAKKIEPGAPSIKRRIRAAEKIVNEGIPLSVRVDPVIPYLNDDEVQVRELIDTLASIGVKHIVTSTYKARPDNFKRMIDTFPELEMKWKKMYYPQGKIKLSYAYLPLDLRKKLLFPVVDEAKKKRLTYATCREDLLSEKYFKAPTCDGTHLIKGPLESRGNKELSDFL